MLDIAIAESTFAPATAGAAAATVDPASTTTSDEAVATGRIGFVTAMFGDTLVGHHVECIAPGTSGVGMSDTITDYLLEHPVPLTLALTGTTVTVVHETEVTCVG